MTGDDKLDRLLAQHFHDNPRTGTIDRDAAARVLTALTAPLPPQRRSWRHWPAALLDWDFAPAWPRVAALAGCAVLGFAIGAVGPTLRHRDAQQMLTLRGDFQLNTVLSEPEPMTGVLP
ncbi:MAG: hypothetical protein GEU91_12870 [Rhizobiales bacterium]|nr:hypothetical protein [Hyphomicrobiales bacterium]